MIKPLFQEEEEVVNIEYEEISCASGICGPRVRTVFNVGLLKLNPNSSLYPNLADPLNGPYVSNAKETSCACPGGLVCDLCDLIKALVLSVILVIRIFDSDAVNSGIADGSFVA